MNTGAPPSQDDLALLQRVAIFGGVREANLRRLASLRPTVARASGEFFFREGEPGETMFVLLSGRVAVLKGRQPPYRVLREIGQGNCFGELSLVDLGPRSGSALALEDCRALQFSQSDFYDLYKSDAEQFTLIQMNMGREVARKLRDTVEKLFDPLPRCELREGHWVTWRE